MANYAETIAYWYLRLNGYLLLNRFVLHRLGDIREDPTDSDLLGVRFQHVYEPIGGQAGDWESVLSAKCFPPCRYFGCGSGSERRRRNPPRRCLRRTKAAGCAYEVGDNQPW